MTNWLILGLMVVSTAHANDYLEGREAALNAQANALSTLGQINPHEYLNDYNEAPQESTIDPHSIEAAGRAKATTDETAQQIIANEQTGEHVLIDLNSDEMRQTKRAIEQPEDELGSKQVPCHEGTCLPLSDEPGDDFGEGVTQLGVLGGVSEEVGSKQINSKQTRIFSGINAQCRTVVKPIGSCCDDKAHLMRCSNTEKALAVAKKESRAFYVGTYCAKSKLGICFVHKESWCMFPTQLSSIIQIQGRYRQLKINFGIAHKKINKADCRGIAPEELQRIDFQKLDFQSITQEYQSRTTPKDTGVMDAQAKEKIDQMEREGRHHG